MTIAEDANVPGPSPFILVVDDSADVREILADVLTDRGYDVQTVASAPEALAAMAERTPDLLITDLLMPGMSGFALRGRMLRIEEFTNIPVVVLSAYWQRPGETLDAAEALTKPIDFEKLTGTVARLTGWGG